MLGPNQLAWLRLNVTLFAYMEKTIGDINRAKRAESNRL